MRSAPASRGSSGARPTCRWAGRCVSAARGTRSVHTACPRPPGPRAPAGRSCGRGRIGGAVSGDADGRAVPGQRRRRVMPRARAQRLGVGSPGEDVPAPDGRQSDTPQGMTVSDTVDHRPRAPIARARSRRLAGRRGHRRTLQRRQLTRQAVLMAARHQRADRLLPGERHRHIDDEQETADDSDGRGKAKPGPHSGHGRWTGGDTTRFTEAATRLGRATGGLCSAGSRSWTRRSSWTLGGCHRDPSPSKRLPEFSAARGVFRYA